MFWFFFFKHKTAYEIRISDWSSDVYSSDLPSLCKPPCVGLDVDHRNCTAELKLRDQLEQECCCRLATGEGVMSPGFRAKAEIPVRGDAAEIEPAFPRLSVERVTERMTESRFPVALECQDAAENRREGLGRVRAASMRKIARA